MEIHMKKNDMVIAWLPGMLFPHELYVGIIEKVNKQSVRVRFQIDGSDHWYTETVNPRYVKLIPSNEEMKIFIKDYFGDDMEDIKDVTYEEAD